jgi:hypothetical protein
MLTCPYRTQGCSLSLPCRKCRAAAIRRAHVFVRYDSQGRRKTVKGSEERRLYEARPDYWHEAAA